MKLYNKKVAIIYHYFSACIVLVVKGNLHQHIRGKGYTLVNTGAIDYHLSHGKSINQTCQRIAKQICQARVKEICAAVSKNSIRLHDINKRTSASAANPYFWRAPRRKMRLRLNIDERRQANKNISAAVISVIDTRSINCEGSFFQHLCSPRWLEVMMKTSLACCCCWGEAGNRQEEMIDCADVAAVVTFRLLFSHPRRSGNFSPFLLLTHVPLLIFSVHTLPAKRKQRG